MVNSCIIIGCVSRQEKGSGLSFCRLPKNPERRRLWLAAIHRKNYNPPLESDVRVCGLHFINGVASEDKCSPDYVPTLNLGYEINVLSSSASSQTRYERGLKRNSTKNINDQGSEKSIVRGTEEGKSAMKRIRLECGVCKATRFYSIHRGITRIAGVVACEACRQFYQRFKKQPWVLNCNKGGRCYEMDETPKSKCKACWVAHIICRCPVPMGLYNHLVGYLPTELKSKMAGRPPTSDEVPEKERGGLGLEIYKDNDWVDVTDKEEVESLLRTEEGNETDETNEPEMDVEIEIEDMVDDSGIPEESSPPKPPNGKNNRQRQKRGKKSEKSESDPDDRVMASLIEGLQVNNQFKFMENFNPKTSERVRRKKKKVQYFSSSGRNKNQMQQAYHGPDGRLLSSGKDLCDCLQPSCPGCHYPCPKCNSGKCGNECRINRKWFYEKVEVEGTQISWTNEYVKKN